jgi:hypothetical protein
MPVIQNNGRVGGASGSQSLPSQFAALEKAFDQRLAKAQALMTLAKQKAATAKGDEKEHWDFSGYTVKPDNASTSFEHLLQRKPGLKKFLELNKDAIFNPQQLKPGQQLMSVAWEGWGHFSVADKERKEEISLVIAKTGDASTPRIQVPLSNGKTIQLPPGYQIVYAGREGDHQRYFEKGGGSQYMQMFDVAGKPGEKLQLAYLRIDPDANGKMHPMYSGWPDSRLGGGEPAWPSDLTGAYPGGRNEVVTVKPGSEPVLIRCPD